MLQKSNEDLLFSKLHVKELIFLSIPLIPYSYGVEGFHFSLDLFRIGRTWTSDRPVSRPLPKHRTTQT
jgi:hypothetical protein